LLKNIELIEPKNLSKFEIELRKVVGLNSDDDDGKENFNIIINVLINNHLLINLLMIHCFYLLIKIVFKNLIMINVDMIFLFYLMGRLQLLHNG